jgi:hypothetical protein
MVEENHSTQDTCKSDCRQKNTDFGELRWVLIGGAWAFIGLLLAAVAWPNLAERMKFFTSNLWILVTAFAVIAQVVIYRKQWSVMQNALRQTEKQTTIAAIALEVGSQAYVCVHSIDLDLAKDRIYIEIENLGRVPADSVQVELWQKLEIPPKFHRKDAAFQSLQGWGEKTGLFPGNLRISMRLPLDLWLGREDIALIKSGDAKLIVEGVITFYDGFLPRKPKDTHFAFEYRLTEKKWFPLRILSPEEEAELKAKKESEKRNPN